MVNVQDIWDDARKIVGNSNDATIFRRITEAVELLANKGDWDPLVGVVDICTSGKLVTLPREVETILGLSMCGTPAVGRDQVYQFHLNGPGMLGSRLAWEWSDAGESPIYREIDCPTKVIAFATAPEDANAELWLYGYDPAQNWIRTKEGNVWHDGYRVPVLTGFQALPADAPTFARVTAARKAKTAGPIRLSSFDDSTQTGLLLGVFQANETQPLYRRIELSTRVEWVRILFRRRTFSIESKYDYIPLHNPAAVTMMLRAMKAYDSPGGLPEAEGFEATALRWLKEEQYTRSPQVAQPIQVHDTLMSDPCDYLD
jgi:hypothetical protein